MSWKQIHDLYGIHDSRKPNEEVEPKFNIAPTDPSWVVRERDGERELVQLRWGLLPFWARSPGEGARMINARSETVATAPAFREAFQSRPCLVVADGFYEWKKIGAKEKQPYFITRKDDQPFAFAGVWQPKSIADADTFTILTTTPNDLCAQVHDRMPVMLAPEDFAGWLSKPEVRKDLLKPFPANDMEMWPVSKAVGSVKNSGPELVVPVTG